MSHVVYMHFALPDACTVRGEALAAVINNHDELMERWTGR